MKNPRIQET